MRNLRIPYSSSVPDMSFTVAKSVSIKSTLSKVWSCLTNTILLQEYFGHLHTTRVFDFPQGKILDTPIADSHNIGGGVVSYELVAKGEQITVHVKHSEIENEGLRAQLDNAWDRFFFAIKAKLEADQV